MPEKKNLSIMSLNEIWTEKELAGKFGLPVTKAGKCIQIGYWVGDGLKYITRSGRRFYFESDVIEFLIMLRNRVEPEKEKDVIV